MQTVIRLLITLACVVVLSGTVLSPIHAESQFPGTHSNEPIRDEKTREILREQEKQRNKQRQEDLKKDTDKLLQLATELKLYVDKTNEDVMSLDVIKKAEQIEKLSKDIQKKMKAE